MSDAFTPIIVDASGARAEVRAYGAHVTSWSTPDGVERLFLSARSAFREGAAIRGGVPIIFPRFSDVGDGPVPRHGFARTRTWERLACDASSATFRLSDDESTRAVWPCAFHATYDVRVSDDTLTLTLTVANVGAETCRFTAALHTYLRVDDVERIAIGGLRGVRYRDQTAGGAERVESGESLGIAGEVDRVYLDVPGPVAVRDGERVVTAHADGFADVVIWNPGAERARALADLEPDGWRRFVCVEAAAVARPVELAPGVRWTGTQRLDAGRSAAR